MTESDHQKLESFMLEDRVLHLREVAAKRTRNLVLVLDGVHDPHNLSATVRSCDAFGLLDLHAIETHARFRVSKKVSQGAEKWLDIHRWSNPEACEQALSNDGFELWVADAQLGSIAIDDLPWEKPLALVFGNEHEGASDYMKKQAAGTFHIPMYGFAESFNVSVAVAISLAIAIRGRTCMLGKHGDLTEEQQEKLMSEWSRRSVRKADLILHRLKSDQANNKT